MRQLPGLLLAFAFGIGLSYYMDRPCETNPEGFVMDDANAVYVLEPTPTHTPTAQHKQEVETQQTVWIIQEVLEQALPTLVPNIRRDSR